MRPVFQTAAVLTLLFSVVASSAEAKSRMDSNRLQELLDKTVDGKRVLGVALNDVQVRAIVGLDLLEIWSKTASTSLPA